MKNAVYYEWFSYFTYLFFFFEDNSAKYGIFVFLICLFKLPYITISRVITATMLFLQFVLYLPSFVGTLKYEIPGAALEPCQLKIEHFSPGILKFNTKHEDTLFTLNCSMVPCIFLFIFHAGLCGLGSKNFRNSSYKEKTASSACVSRLSFRFL